MKYDMGEPSSETLPAKDGGTFVFGDDFGRLPGIANPRCMSNSLLTPAEVNFRWGLGFSLGSAVALIHQSGFENGDKAKKTILDAIWYLQAELEQRDRVQE